MIAPGVEGQLAVLPQHAAFMTMLGPGKLILKKGSEEMPFAVTGGFFEVLDNKVVVLADAASARTKSMSRGHEEARERARAAIERRETHAGPGHRRGGAAAGDNPAARGGEPPPTYRSQVRR